MVALREPTLILDPELETVETLPRRVRQHFQRGKKFFGERDFKRALREYDAALSLRPNLPEVLNNRGNARSALGDHQGAIADYTEALRMRPDYPGALNNRGNARSMLVPGDYQGAIADYTEALRLRQDLPETLTNRALALAALARYEEALASVNAALALRPDDAEAQALHREVLEKRLKDLVAEGFARWSGGKPKGMKRPVKLKSGPPISDYIVEERERLRG